MLPGRARRSSDARGSPSIEIHGKPFERQLVVSFLREGLASGSTDAAVARIVHEAVLTPAQESVLRSWLESDGRKQVSVALGIEPPTVKCHTDALRRRIAQRYETEMRRMSDVCEFVRRLADEMRVR